MGELVETAKALSAPATKLVEVVSRGIGRAYDPRYKRKMADAAAYELDTLAGAIRRNGDVPILFDREGIQLDARNAQDLVERAQMRFFTQEVRKQQNIEAIVDKAYEELKNSEVVSDEPVDDDWIVRFFNSVEDVSNEKLQEIWAKILAGEIKKPRSSSLRTLDVLKNLSVDEATIFEKVSSCACRNGDSVFIPKKTDLWNEQDVSFDDLMALSDAGIVNLSFINRILYIRDEKNIIYNNYLMGTLQRSSISSPESIIVSAYFLTETGKDIYRLISINQTRSREFLLAYLSYLKKENMSVSVSAYDIIGVTDRYLEHNPKDLLE